jgi:hypothetical protein
MIRENLNDLNKEIIQIFDRHNIQESDMLGIYQNCLKDFERAYVTKIEIEENLLNSLRDIIWYNLEHKDEHDLTRLGNVFPTFMTFCDKDNIISLDETQNLIGELNEIHRNFNEKPMYFCYMTGPLENFEDNTSKVNFIDKRQDKKLQNDYVKVTEITCFIEDEISAYPLKQAKINSFLMKLKEACQECIKNKSKIMVGFI